MVKRGLFVVMALLVAVVSTAQFGRALPPPELTKLSEQLGLEVTYRGGQPAVGDTVEGKVADPLKLGKAGIAGAAKGDAVVLTFAGAGEWTLELVKQKREVPLQFREGKWKLKPEGIQPAR